MRCILTLKDDHAMERVMGALARYKYMGGREYAALEPPQEWNSLLEISSSELEGIRDHVNAGDIVEVRPMSEAASSRLH